jgi:hypothetical protein
MGVRVGARWRRVIVAAAVSTSAHLPLLNRATVSFLTMRNRSMSQTLLTVLAATAVTGFAITYAAVMILL